MRLELYTAGVSQARLLDWKARLSEGAQASDIEMTHSSVRERPEVLREKLPVVLEELCLIPEQRVDFHSSDAERLCTFAYTNYRSRIDRNWHVSLYFPSKAAIFLPFDEKLVSRRVAHLYYQAGTSDKVYHLYLTQPLMKVLDSLTPHKATPVQNADDFYAVISRYGRRDGKLQQTKKVFDSHLEAAEKEWNRLHHNKIQKGYKVGHPSPPQQLELALSFR